MQYILKRTVSPEHLQGWKIEPCSPFEVSGAVMSGATILCWKTAEALTDFFGHAREALADFFGHPENPAETLNYDTEFPAEFKPGDIVFFIFCPRPGTFQFWKGQKN